MKIVGCSDNHGNLKVKSPECDILLHAGDIFGSNNLVLQEAWLPNFNDWLDKQPAKHKVLIAGNHDWYMYECWKARKKPKVNCHYLLDWSIEIEGIRIYGTPWQPVFFDWAFNLPEEDLEKKWVHFPVDTDILLVHGPPYGILDKAPRHRERGYEHVGSPSLKERIFEIKPKLVVFGHVHESYGIEVHEEITFVNCSVLNGDYKLVNEPVVVEL
jgi:Icc-related predicted phosphoesterase